MRRIISGIIVTAVLFVFGLYICGAQMMTAYAADTMNISLSSASGKPGDTVTVEIEISNNPGFNSLKLMIGYDSQNLTLVSAENSGILSGMQYVGSQTIDKNPYIMVWAQAGNVTENGKAAVLTFKINDEAYSGDTAFSFECDFCTNQDIKYVDYSLSSGSVSISGGKDRPAGAATPTPSGGQTGSDSQTQAPSNGTQNNDTPSSGNSDTQSGTTPSSSGEGSQQGSDQNTGNTGSQGNSGNNSTNNNSSGSNNSGNNTAGTGADGTDDSERTLWPLWFLLLIPVCGIAGYVVYRKKSKK